MINYVEKDVLTRDDIYFNDERLENYIKFSEKWYFPLDPWEKFLAAFVFLYIKENDELFYEEYFYTLGRGGGKNGFISTLSHFFISPLHGIKNYDVSIVANSEDQAQVSFKEVYGVIKENAVLEKQFELTKVKITGKATNSVFRFRTSNASTKDGGREGCVIYDEIHEMEDREVVDVFSGGLGKVPNPREFFIGTNGFIREGFYDKLMTRCLDVLSGANKEDRIFPFICRLDSKDEVEDEAMWEKANPAFEKPLTPRAERLLNKVRKQSKDPGGRVAFMTKRMNFPEQDLSRSVASWDEILATNRPVPELQHKLAVGSLDFASIKDFAACGLLFKVEEDYIFKTHSFVRKGFLDMVKLKPPIKEWESQGLLTIVDEPVINISHIVEWFVEARMIYGIDTIVADTFRLDLVKTALEAEGFRIIYIRNPNAASAKLAPRIETLFAEHHIIFGDNPLMRWYCQNVEVKIDNVGNKSFKKKDEIRRKTDGFMAFLYAMWEADNILLDGDIEFVLNDLVF